MLIFEIAAERDGPVQQSACGLIVTEEMLQTNKPEERKKENHDSKAVHERYVMGDTMNQLSK
jgi:hypothetical protein